MRTRLALAAAAAVTAAGLSVPATAAAPVEPPEPAVLQQVDGSVTRTYSVPTRHGALFLEVVHPTRDGAVLPAHGVLTLSPYSVLGRNGDAGSYVPRGYARMWADVVGTGNSGGCYDYGGTREKETAFDLVEWVARQPWSRGRLAMTGGSYDGTTATAAAVGRPKGLATIVPEAAISRWYDYAYSSGMRYFLGNEALSRQGPGAVTDEGFDTPFAFDFGLAVPPPLDVESPDWAERFADAVRVCDELEHTTHGYDLTPDYDAFWVERDYARLAPAVRIPVLVAHNWGDWNVKQDTATRLFAALTGSPQSRLWMGTRWDGHGRPGGDYAAVKLAWIDRWVGGVRNGVERRLARVTTETSDATGPLAVTTDPRPRPLVLRPDAGLALRPGAGAAGLGPAVPFSVAGTETTSLLTGGADAVVLQTPPLARDVRLVGSAAVRLGLATGRTWTTLAPSVVDLDPAAGPDPAAAVAVTRGWIDTRYARSLAAPVPGDGTGLAATVVAKPTDYVFRKGHRIAVVVATSSAEWVLAKAYDGAPCAGCAQWALQLGGTAVTLPLVGAGDPRTLFAG